MPPTPDSCYGSIGADLISAVAAESNEELASGLAQDFAQMSSAQARFLVRLGEFERRQGYRDDGATSLESWTAERFGRLGAERSGLCPCRGEGLGHPSPRRFAVQGEISFDKVRALADVATPESDRLLCDQAKVHSVRELADIARSKAELARTPSSSSSRSDGRFLRFNDTYRTISAQLPADAYAETKAHIDAQLEQIPSEGATPLDQRRCDVLLGLLRCAVQARPGPPPRPPPPAPMSSWPTSPWPPWSRTQARRAPWPASSSTAA